MQRNARILTLGGLLVALATGSPGCEEQGTADRNTRPAASPAPTASEQAAPRRRPPERVEDQPSAEEPPVVQYAERFVETLEQIGNRNRPEH